MELKSFFRYVGRNKTYTLINVIGFALSLAFVILTMAYTWQESTVDHFHKDADRIQMMYSYDDKLNKRWLWVSSWPMGEMLKSRYPEIEETNTVVQEISTVSGATFMVEDGERKMPAHAIFTEPNFFTFFSYPLLSGSPESVLQDPYSAVVSSSFARRFFGEEDPIGKSLRISEKTSVTVTGVMEDMKHSFMANYDMVLRIERASEFSIFVRKGFIYDYHALTFVKMRPGTDLNMHKDDILDWLQSFHGQYSLEEDGSYVDVRFVNLEDIYLADFNPSIVSARGGDVGSPDSAGLKFGDPSLVKLLWLASILLLCFSMANYINLSISQSVFRFKEAATRRLLGASRFSVQWRMMLESLLLCVVAFVLGYLLALAIAPWFEDLLRTRIDFALLYSAEGLLLCMVLILAVALASGALPSGIVSSVKPIDVVNGKVRRKSKMFIGKVFVVFQNAATFLLLSVALVVIFQVRALVNAPLGYETDRVMQIKTNFLEKEEQIVLANELKKLPCVERLGFCYAFLNVQSVVSYPDRGTLCMTEMDSAALEILGIPIYRDNRQAVPDGYFFNQEALDVWGASYDADYVEWGDGGNDHGRIPVCGIMGSFKTRYSVLNEVDPYRLKLSEIDDFENEPTEMVMRITGRLDEAYQQVERAVKSLIEEPVSIRYVDDSIQVRFLRQMRLGRIITFFGLVALLVSLLGLVAMSVFYMRQRLQEVAVRKVFGADNGQVFWHLVKPFMAYVAIGIVLGLPVAWYLSEAWLEAFSYRLRAYGWLFLPVAAFCLLVSFAAVGIQGRIASRTNPAENIKTE